MARLAVITTALALLLAPQASALTDEQVRVFGDLDAFDLGLHAAFLDPGDVTVDSGADSCRRTTRTRGSCRLSATITGGDITSCTAVSVVKQRGDRVWSVLRDVNCG